MKDTPNIGEICFVIKGRLRKIYEAGSGLIREVLFSIMFIRLADKNYLHIYYKI